MCMLDEIRAKRDKIYAIARRHKAEKLWGGYLDTERFVGMMSRSPEDYTTWHRRYFDNGESVRELGEKIKKSAVAKRQNAMA